MDTGKLVATKHTVVADVPAVGGSRLAEMRQGRPVSFRRLAAIRQVLANWIAATPPRVPSFARVAFTGGSRVV